MPRLGKVRRVAWRFEPLSSVEPIALVRLQSDTMCSGLQFSSLIRAGLGVGLELSTFLRSSVRSRSALLAENLFLRKQLAFYQDRQIRPRSEEHTSELQSRQ